MGRSHLIKYGIVILEQPQQMSHQAVRQVFKSILVQTFCFLPYVCCALKQTRQRVCNVKSVLGQVC